MLFRIWLKLFRFIPAVGLFLGPGNRSILRDVLEDFRPAKASPDIFETLVAENTPREIKKRLKDYGVVVIPGAIRADALQQPAAELLRFAEQIEKKFPNGGDNPDITVSSGSHDYATLRDSERPVAVVREGSDAGMIDIFHVDAFLNRRGIDLQNILRSSGVVDTIAAVLPGEFELRNVNAYINRGVIFTRGFHVDSYGGNQLKAFIYLTDVTSLDNGPYCYVIGSHSDSGFPILNTVLAKFLGRRMTDVSAFERTNALPLLGESGTLLVSNQSGAHRGYPQTPDGERVLLALNFQKI